MASIVLEPVNPQESVEAEEPVEEEPAALVQEAEQETEQAPPEKEGEQVLTPVEVAEPTPPAPAPKKRGRPPKAKAEPKAPGLPKAKPAPKPKPRARKAPPPESESDSSTDVEDTLKNVYNHALSTHSTTSMETAILEFLVNRKQSEQTRRKELWSQLAKC